MSESYIKRTPEQLVAELTLVTQADETVHAKLGLTQAELTTALAALSAGTVAINAKKAAVASVTAASKAKIAAKAQAVAILHQMVETAQASAATDADLVSVGFPPRRSSTPRPTTPQTVTNLKAVPAIDGTVRISHDRGSNSVHTTFVLESSAQSTDWAMVSASPRVTTRLKGHVPGVTRYFRVISVNAGVASEPTEPVGIYAPTAAAIRAHLELVKGNAA